VTSHDDADRLDRLLAALPAAPRSESRDARVRARCHAMLAARRHAANCAGERSSTWKRSIAPVLVGGFCLAYVAALVWRVVG
jgi:hypothetical protein